MTLWTRLFSQKKEIVMRPIGFEPAHDIDRRKKMDEEIASNIARNREMRYETMATARDNIGYFGVMTKWAELVRNGQ